MKDYDSAHSYRVIKGHITRNEDGEYSVTESERAFQSEAKRNEFYKESFEVFKKEAEKNGTPARKNNDWVWYGNLKEGEGIDSQEIWYLTTRRYKKDEAAKYDIVVHEQGTKYIEDDVIVIERSRQFRLTSESERESVEVKREFNYEGSIKSPEHPMTYTQTSTALFTETTPYTSIDEGMYNGLFGEELFQMLFDRSEFLFGVESLAEHIYQQWKLGLDHLALIATDSYAHYLCDSCIGYTSRLVTNETLIPEINRIIREKHFPKLSARSRKKWVLELEEVKYNSSHDKGFPAIHYMNFALNNPSSWESYTRDPDKFFTPNFDPDALADFFDAFLSGISSCMDNANGPWSNNKDCVLDALSRRVASIEYGNEWKDDPASRSDYCKKVRELLNIGEDELPDKASWQDLVDVLLDWETTKYDSKMEKKLLKLFQK